MSGWPEGEGCGHLVLDRHSAHRSRKVRAWLANHPDRIELHFLPSLARQIRADPLHLHDSDQRFTWLEDTSAAVLAFRAPRVRDRLRPPPGRAQAGISTLTSVRYPPGNAPW